MKKIISIFLFFCILQPLFSQRLGGKLEYNFSSSQEMFERAQFLERRHNETKAHLDGIIDEILKLRASTNDKKFDEYLQKWHDYFSQFYNQALAHESVRQQIYKSEREMKTAIVNYKKEKELREKQEKIKQETYVRQNTENNTTSDVISNYENAYNLYLEEKYSKSLEILKGMAEYSSDERVFFLKGFIELFYMSDIPSSIKSFEKATIINKLNYTAFYYVGYNYEIMESFSNSIKYYSQCIKINSNFLVAYFRRAISKSNLEDMYGAINDYDYIINFSGKEKESFSAMATVYNNKAYCLIKQGKYKEAVPLVDLALRTDNSIGYIWDTKGELNYHMGMFKECISDMNKSIDIEESANSYYYRGLARIKINIKEAGCLDLSKAGELGKIEAYEMIQKYCANTH